MNLADPLYSQPAARPYLNEVARQISLICDKLNYEASKDGEFWILVPKNDSIRAAAEAAPESVAYDLINYDYREYKGDLQAKRQILLRLLDDLEPKRDALKAANKELANELFKLANKYNIRHNNSGVGGKGNAEVEGITPEEQEEWYDTCRDLCAAAYLLLENRSQITTLKGAQ